MATQATEKDLNVLFEDLQPTYASNQDIFVVYSLGANVQSTSRDWVGLYKSEWTCPKQYIAFEWAPQKPRDEKFPSVRSVLFRSKYIHVVPNADQRYQFLYVTKNDVVLGRSTMFRLYDEVTSDDDTSLECVDRHIDGAGSLTIIRTQPDKHKGILESFELIHEIEPDILKISTQVKELIRQAQLHESLSTTTESNDQFDMLRIVDAMDQSGHVERAEFVADESLRKEFDDVNLSHESPDDTNLSNEPFEDVNTPNESEMYENQDESLSDEGAQESDEFVQPDELMRAGQFPSQLVRPGLVPIYNAASQNATLRPLPFIFPSQHSIRENFGRCRCCKERKARHRQLQHKVLSSKLESHTLRHDLRSAEQKIAMKEIVLAEMSSQIKGLIQENTKLTATNNNLAESVQSASKLESEHERLTNEIVQLSASMETLMANTDYLAAEKEMSDAQWELEKKKSEQLEEDKRVLFGELGDLRCSQCELEAQLDDIMYTLSLQGYTSMVKANGDIVDLTKKEGNVVELFGSTATKCEQEKHEDTINLQAQMILDYRKSCDSLSNELNTWKSNITDKDQKLSDVLLQLADENNKVISLRSEATSLERQLHSAAEVEQSNRRELLDLKKEKSKLLLEHEEREAKLKQRIKSARETLREYKKAIPANSSLKKNTGSQTLRVKTSDKVVHVQYGSDPAPIPGVQLAHTCTAPPLCTVGVSAYTGLFNGNTGIKQKSNTKLGTRKSTPFAKKSVSVVRPKTNKIREQALKETNFGVRSSADQFFALCDTHARNTDSASIESDAAYCADIEEEALATIGKDTSSVVTAKIVSKTVVGEKNVTNHRTHSSDMQQETGYKKIDINTDPGNHYMAPSVSVLRHRGSNSSAILVKPVEIVDSTCTRCGLVFPPETDQSRINKHKRMHSKFGY